MHDALGLIPITATRQNKTKQETQLNLMTMEGRK
jgi:hypothetical protein